MERMTWKHIVLGLLGFSFGVWFCMPRDMSLAPRWEVLVQDGHGRGLAGAEVTWTREADFAPALNGYTLQTADAWGRAAFPAVSVHTSPLLRTFACVRMLVRSVHGTCGYRQNIVAAADHTGELKRTEETLPLKGRGKLLTITLLKNE